MNTISLRFVEHDVLHKLSHYLPAQNPLKDFVHHNTLHAFQDLPFYKALQMASNVFGYKTYLSLSEFREKYIKGEIPKEILREVILNRKIEHSYNLWLDKLVNQEYDESIYPKIGKLRSQWKIKYAINLDKATHGTLFRVLCSYLDQGISIWPFPIHNQGFLASIKEIEKNNLSSFFKSNRVKKLLQKEASIFELLSLLVGDEKLLENCLFDQHFSHTGCSGLVATLEANPFLLLE